MRGVSKTKEAVKRIKQAPKKKATGSTHKSTWKKMEQRVADLFGAKRTPLSGMANSMTKADMIHHKIFIEAKLRANSPMYDLYLETEAKAKKENKIPVVAIQKKNHSGFLLILRPEDLENVLKYVKRKNGESLEGVR
jgi:hypothetical protein